VEDREAVREGFAGSLQNRRVILRLEDSCQMHGSAHRLCNSNDVPQSGCRRLSRNISAVVIIFRLCMLQEYFQGALLDFGGMFEATPVY
jgi:hypothetical protein